MSETPMSETPISGCPQYPGHEKRLDPHVWHNITAAR